MGIYNCADTLDEAIESVLNQTYKNWELVMCDDCSTDNTYNIAKRYSDKYDNIVLLKNEKNMRLAYSLNRCLEVSRGKYIARMDADDENMPERLEKQVEFLNEHEEYQVVGSSMMVFDDIGIRGIRAVSEYPMNKVWITTPFAHPTIMMRKSAYDELNGYNVSKDTMRAEDIELWFRFKNRGFNGYNIQEPLYKYRESINDYKKRTLKAAIGTAKVYIKGYKLLGYSKVKYIYVLKPVISACIPNSLMYMYQNIRIKRKKSSANI